MNSATITPAHKFIVRGRTDEVTTCELCGREDLSHTIALEVLDADGNGTGEVTYYGSECGARAAGWTAREFRANVKAHDTAVRDWLRAEREFADDQYHAARDAWLLDNYGVADLHAAAKLAGCKFYALVVAFETATGRR
ncbi:hypothetical protein DS6A_48 [Mycobacterium phage DS6A]|uniref:Uncharacterized protein n=1 Tax=Mycobacterium phage DS6A TaxID=45764 RepID=G8I4F8_9CAUD|nr:hypothetical protein DS6A_48 [Mycobacterium phage DS6A]AER47602.1 hypothetical protein DS6A_48 [Mycobacterium phage DS6A]